jgi:hypothetical protein
VSNALTVVNRRSSAVVEFKTPVQRRDIERMRSKRGWVMVPGMNYMRKIESVIADQFEIMADSLTDKRVQVDEHLLGLIETLQSRLIEAVQLLAKNWASAEANCGDEIITRAMAGDEALQIVAEHFNKLHTRIASYGLVDLTNPEENRIILELECLEESVNIYLSRLINGWK